MFIVYLYVPVCRIWIAAHDLSTTRCMHVGFFLPYYAAKIIKTNVFAKSYDFRVDGNDLITTVISRACKLVAYIDAQAPTWFKYSITFSPNKIQMIDIVLVTLIESYLSFCPIILQLPIRWRCHDKSYRFFLNL